MSPSNPVMDWPTHRQSNTQNGSRQREGEVWVEVDRNEGLAGPVTWILFLSVSTCRRWVWTRLTKVSPPWKTSWAELTFSQSVTPPPFSYLLLFYYQWVSQTVWKTEGMAEESLTSLFDTAHVCLVKNSPVCRLGPASTDQGWATSCCGFTGVRADSSGSGCSGLWDVIHSVFVSIVCVYTGALLRMWSSHNRGDDISDTSVEDFPSVQQISSGKTTFIV